MKLHSAELVSPTSNQTAFFADSKNYEGKTSIFSNDLIASN